MHGHRHRPQASPPVVLYTPSPSSSSSSSSASSSAAVATTATRPIPTRSPPSSVDDGEAWASIRLASSPPKTQPVKPVATLSIDDFSHERVGRVPSSTSSSTSGWSLRRAKTLAEDKSGATPPPPPPPPLPRAQSLPPEPHNGDTMDARVFVSRDQWVHHKLRRACVVCDREFGLAVLRKKHSCRMCGDVVCSRCSLFKAVRVPGVGESRARVCARCVVEYRQRATRVLAPSTRAVAVPSRVPSPLPILEEPAEEEVGEEEVAEEEEDAYGSCDELPSVEDVMRRTAAKVTGSTFVFAGGDHAPFRRGVRSHKPVALLAPEMFESMYRESVCLAKHARLQREEEEDGGAEEDEDEFDWDDDALLPHSRAPSMVLLSPNTAHELQLPLFDLERISSISSTVTSSTSSSSSSLSSSSLRIEEELMAAAKARELEKEVTASRERIAELERRMAEQATTLSMEQQAQLAEARALIATLQQQLRQQEQQAKDAAIARDSLCLANSIQRAKRSASIESTGTESEVLRRQLRLLERQLQHAGLSAAEHIPYAVAKQRVAELAQRMAEISDHEAQLKTQPNTKQAVAALRREYFVLEQDMERFHTALLLSDEYLAEQRAAERSWEDANAAANAQALRTVRAALPVTIAQLSEAALRRVATPSGRPLLADLARRFKRTNILQLLRVAPTTLIKMHPSVVESYRTTGLALLERRALHAALQQPMVAWAAEAGHGNNNLLSGKKHAWARKLRDAFAQALTAFEQHASQHHADGRVESATCPFLGKMCVLRAEKAVELLYHNSPLGFPEGDEYAPQEIVRSSDATEGGGGGGPEGASGGDERTLAEAAKRQALLKHHYKNVRQATMALAAMEELDAAMERLRRMDEDAMVDESGGEGAEQEEERRWEALVVEARDTLSEMARRAGICLSGKRDAAKDAVDTRSSIEATASREAAAYIESLVEDLSERLSSPRWRSALGRIRELLVDVQRKNDALLIVATRPRVLTAVAEEGTLPSRRRSVVKVDEPVQGGAERIRWSERSSPKTSDCSRPSSLMAPPCSPLPPLPPPPSPVVPRSSVLLDAIRLKKSESSPSSSFSSSAVRAAEPVAEEPNVAVGEAVMLAYPVAVEAHKPGDLLAAIRARKTRASVVPSAA